MSSHLKNHHFHIYFSLFWEKNTTILKQVLLLAAVCCFFDCNSSTAVDDWTLWLQDKLMLSSPPQVRWSLEKVKWILKHNKIENSFSSYFPYPLSEHLSIHLFPFFFFFAPHTSILRWRSTAWCTILSLFISQLHSCSRNTMFWDNAIFWKNLFPPLAWFVYVCFIAVCFPDLSLSLKWLRNTDCWHWKGLFLF